MRRLTNNEVYMIITALEYKREEYERQVEHSCASFGREMTDDEKFMLKKYEGLKQLLLTACDILIDNKCIVRVTEDFLDKRGGLNE